MIDPDKTLVMISAWPDGECSFKLMEWLDRRGFHMRYCHIKGPYVAARNQSINKALQLAERAPIENVLFMDRDLRPDVRTDRWLRLPGDLVGCQYDNGRKDGWTNPQRFHTACWRADITSLRLMREVLGCGMTSKWMSFRYSPCGTRLIACDCAELCAKAVECDLHVCHGGYVEHPSGGRSWCQGV